MTAISAGDLAIGELDPERAEHLGTRASHAVTIDVGGEMLCVAFEEREWAAAFAERYADQLAAATRPDVRHYVARDGAGYVFWSPGIAAWRWDAGELPPEAIVFLADATAIGSLLSTSATLVSFHAAAVAFENAAAAIVGDSNAGKTTTAIACGLAGLRVFSDERCVVRGTTVMPFARTLNVRRDGWARLQPNRGAAVDPPGARATSEGFRVRPSALFGPLGADANAELRAVFVLGERAPLAAVRPIATYEAVPFLARWMNGGEAGLGRAARLLETLRGVACYRLTLGSPQASAALVRAALMRLARCRAS